MDQGMDQSTLDTLLKKGAISQSTRDMGAARFPEVPQSSPETPPENLPAAPLPSASVPESPAPTLAAAAPSSFSPTPAIASGQAPAQNPIKLASDNSLKPAEPSHINGLEQAYELEQKAIAQKGQAESQQAQAESNILGKTQRDIQTQQDTVLLAESKRQTELDNKLKDIDLASKKAAETASIDPDRFWKNKGTGEKIGFAIDAFLGGYRTSGKNNALEYMKDSIDKDIDAQKQDYERAKGNVGMQQSLYSDMMKKFGDTRMAESASRLAILGNAELQLKQKAAQFKSPAIQGATLQAMTHVEKEKQMLVATAKHAAEVQQAEQRMSGNSANSQLKVDFNKLTPEKQARYVNGIGFANTPDAQKKAAELAGNTKSVTGMIDELSKMREEQGTAFWPTAKKEKMQLLASKLQLAMKEAEKLGTLDKGSEKMMERLVGDPTRIGQVLAQLQALKGSIQNEHDIRMKEYVPGWEPVKLSKAK